MYDFLNALILSEREDFESSQKLILKTVFEDEMEAFVLESQELQARNYE
jgi:BMFP domain-containing protein YqiC